MRISLWLYIWQNLSLDFATCGLKKKGLHQHILENMSRRHDDIMIRSTKEGYGDKDTSKNKNISMTVFLCDLLSCILASFSHDSRAETTSSLQSPQEERKGTSNWKTTHQEEITTSTSDHLGPQCSYNISASQHHHHYNDRCTSSGLEDDIKEEKDLLATCFHLCNVDIKDGERYMFNFPPTTTSTNTYSLRR